MGCQRIPQTTTDLEPISSPSSARSARTDSRDGSCRASARSCLRHMRARWDRSTSTMPPSASAANTLEPAGLRSRSTWRRGSRFSSSSSDARDSSQVDAFLLAGCCALRGAGDVAQPKWQRAPPSVRCGTTKPRRSYWRSVCGCTLASSPAAPRRPGQLDVETDFGGTVQVGPAGQRSPWRTFHTAA